MLSRIFLIARGVFGRSYKVKTIIMLEINISAMTHATIKIALTGLAPPMEESVW